MAGTESHCEIFLFILYSPAVIFKHPFSGRLPLPMFSLSTSYQTRSYRRRSDHSMDLFQLHVIFSAYLTVILWTVSVSSSNVFLILYENTSGLLKQHIPPCGLSCGFLRGSCTREIPNSVERWISYGEQGPLDYCTPIRGPQGIKIVKGRAKHIVVLYYRNSSQLTTARELVIWHCALLLRSLCISCWQQHSPYWLG